jgi:hypothetical protein
LGNVKVLLSGGGGVQLWSIGLVAEGGELGGGEVFTGGNKQLLPRKRHKIMIRQVNRYFRFIPFIDKLLTSPLVMIITSEY